MTPTVLLTLGRLPKALTLARALHRAGCRVIVAEPFRWHVCKPSNSVARCYRVTAPNTDRAAYLDELLAIIEREHVELVVPVSEEALHVAQLRPRLPAGVRLLGPGLSTIVDLHDKLRFARRAAELGLSVPATEPAGSTEAIALSRAENYVVKPIDGCSGIGLQLCEKNTPLGDLPQGMLVQRRVEGRHISTLSYYSSGLQLVTVCYEGIVYAGTVAICFQRVDNPPAIEAWINRFCADLDFTGFIAFDFIVDEQDVPWAIECNPRVTSGIHFLDENALGQALLDPSPASRVPVDDRHPRFQWAYSTLTEAYAAVFRPAEFWRRMRALVAARDVVWSLSDPLPFLLMTPMSWEILWPAMTSGVSMGEASQRDIAWLSTGSWSVESTPPAVKAIDPGGEHGS